MHFRTRAIHVGQHPDPATGSVIPPIHLASTYIQKGIGIPAEYDYARTGTPTDIILKRRLPLLMTGSGHLHSLPEWRRFTAFHNFLHLATTLSQALTFTVDRGDSFTKYWPSRELL